MRYIILSFLLLLSSLAYSQKYTATETVIFPSVFREQCTVVHEITELSISSKEVTIINAGDTLVLRIVAPFSRREEGDCLLETFAALSGDSKFIVGYSYQRKNLLNLGLLDSSNRFLMFIVSLKTESL